VGVTACTGGGGGSPQQVPGADEVASANQVRVLIDQGIAQGKQGQTAQAKATFEKVLTLDATNKYAWFNLGYLAQMSNKPDEAITNYNHALTSDPSYTPAMYNKAIILESRDPDAAMALYQQILTINPKATTTYFRRGLMQLKRGDRTNAAANFQQALKLDPSLRGEVPAEFGGTKTEKPS